jgi:hypothetical protein
MIILQTEKEKEIYLQLKDLIILLKKFQEMEKLMVGLIKIKSKDIV